MIFFASAAAAASTNGHRASTDAASVSNGTSSGINNSSSSNGSSDDPALLTLDNVQLLQPRGRFDLSFRKGGVSISGKAGAVDVSWANVRHVLRLPRPEGYNWGKNLNPEDPAGSDLLALPLKESVPFRKNKARNKNLEGKKTLSDVPRGVAVDGRGQYSWRCSPA